MNFIKRLFRKKSEGTALPPIPSWDEIKDIMYDRNLDAFQAEIVEVIYSKDRSMRYVVTKDKNDAFYYCLEVIYPFDEDDWQYIGVNEGALPAMWQEHPDAKNISIFDSKEGALLEIYSEPFYKNYF